MRNKQNHIRGKIGSKYVVSQKLTTSVSPRNLLPYATFATGIFSQYVADVLRIRIWEDN